MSDGARDLVTLDIDGRRVIALAGETILETARRNGVGSIPTLCHDDQLEPFASCFVCVVKVHGARTLLPACSTRVAAGMTVETNTPEVRRARKASLELMLSNHFADCIGPCQLACPAGIDIQGYLALAALGRYGEAITLIKDRNPLPAVCGRVCTRPCEVKGCRRTLLDDPVGIDYIKRYIADLDLAKEQPWRPEKAAPNGRRVAVVGGGPAGLSCAWYLAIRGYGVRVLEALPEAGGMLRYGIPEYRLPKEVLDLEIRQILDLGVELTTNVALGRDFTVASLLQEGYAAVFLGIGAWESSRMRVQDEETPGVLPGIDFLREYGLQRAPRLPGRVLVVGGGNTAIDCARTSLRLGADEVRLLYRRTRKEMPANAMEIDEAEREGVKMDFLVAPVRVVSEAGRLRGLECQRMELGEPDASGRRSPKPVPGSEFLVEGDWVIAAIGQNTEVKKLVEGKAGEMFPPGERLGLTRWQTILVNEKTFETTVEGVFSGGDVVTGAATAIEAIAAGRKAAWSIHTYLTEGKARPEPAQFNSRKDVFRQVSKEDLPEGARHGRSEMPTLPVEERIRSFAEVETGLDAGTVRTEAARCLECGCVALFDCDLRRYATEYEADVTAFLGEACEYRPDRRHPLIDLDPNKCILCGRCVRICSEVVGVSAFGFVQRGFRTVVKPALGGGLIETECVSCGLCIGTCPTGAIAEKSRLEKPGPWPTVATPAVCGFCGTGCRLQHETYGDLVVTMARREGEGTLGNHCVRGRFGYGHEQAPVRLRAGAIRTGEERREVPVVEAIAHAGLRLEELRRRHTGEEIAVFLSPRLTNEEIYLAQKFARTVLGTHQVATLASLVNRELDCPDVVSTATYADLEAAEAIVVVNSRLADEHFVVDLMAKKAIRRGAKLICIGDAGERVERYADLVLRCPAGREPDALLALLQASRRPGSGVERNAGLAAALDATTLEALAEKAGIEPGDARAAAGLLHGASAPVLVTNRDWRGARMPRDLRFFAEAAEALGCGLLALREKANGQGMADLGGSPDWLPGYQSFDDPLAVATLEREWGASLGDVRGARADLAEKLRRREIRVAIVLGEDPLGHPDFPRDLSEGLGAADLLVVADLLPTETAWRAHALLPLSSAAETSGTLTNQVRGVQGTARAVLPGTGIETWELFGRLAAAMGRPSGPVYASPAEITAEIRRCVPAYRDVQIDATDARGHWPLSEMRLPRLPFDYAQLTAERKQPVPTLHLDYLEARFDGWFAQIHDRARRALRELEKTAAS